MDPVAFAAGLSKGTLYSRYPHKEELFRAVILYRVEAWAAETSKDNRKHAERLEARMNLYLRVKMRRGVSAESRAFGRLLSSGSDLTPDYAEKIYEMRYQSLVQNLTVEIRELTRAEGRPARHPRKVALVLTAALAGWIRLETSRRVVPEREAVAFGYHTVGLLLAGRSAW